MNQLTHKQNAGSESGRNDLKGSSFSADKRIERAILETDALLNKELSYQTQFQRPAQIAFYQAHIDYLLARLAGREAVAPKADTANWNVSRCARDARR